MEGLVSFTSSPRHGGFFIYRLLILLHRFGMIWVRLTTIRWLTMRLNVTDTTGTPNASDWVQLLEASHFPTYHFKMRRKA